MLRRLFNLIIYVTVARWMYAEIQLTAPQLVPALDYCLQVVTIPTHDKWPKESMEEFLRSVEVAAFGKPAIEVAAVAAPTKEVASAGLTQLRALADLVVGVESAQAAER